MATDGWWRGKLFPNACEYHRYSFEARPDPLVPRLRHLPTAGILEEAASRLPPAARPVLAAWRALWADAVADVEAFAADVGAGEDFEAWRTGALAEAGERHADGKRLSAAVRTMALLAQDGARVRERALHVIEDARTHLALADSGLAVAIRAGDGYVGKLASERGLRLLGGPGHARLIRTARRAERISDRADNPYWTSPAFRERAGRPMAVADGQAELALVLADMAGQGHAKAFLKATECKAGTWIVALDPDPIRQDALLVAALGQRLRALNGMGSRERQMLVQGWTPFLREHRFFVVGHRVVASTPSTRTLSVLDADPRRLLGRGLAELARPALTEGAYDRGAAETVQDRAVLARMAAGARDLARALGREPDAAPLEPGHGSGDRRGDCYVIDMGETPDGRVLPIEINGFRSAGLYALDYPRVVRALERRAARFSGIPAETRAVPRPPQVAPTLLDVIEDILDMPDAPDMSVPEGAPRDADTIPPGELPRAWHVHAYARLDGGLPEAMEAWGRGLFPATWHLRPPPGPGPLVRAIATGAEAAASEAGILPAGAAPVLVEALAADGTPRSIAPFAGLPAAPAAGETASGRREAAYRFPAAAAPDFPPAADAIEAAIAAMPPYQRGRFAQAFALHHWPLVEPSLRATGAGLDLGGTEQAAARIDFDRHSGLRRAWQDFLREHVLAVLESGRGRLAGLLSRASNGTLHLAIEFPVPVPLGPGTLAATLANRALGRRWRLLYHGQRAREAESCWPSVPPDGPVALVSLEAAAAVGAVDFTRTLAEGVAWHADPDAIYLRPGTSVLLRGAWYADEVRPCPGFEEIARRYRPVDLAAGAEDLAA